MYSVNYKGNIQYLHYVPFSPADGCSDKYNKDPFVINWGYAQTVAHLGVSKYPMHGVVLYEGKGIPYVLGMFISEDGVDGYTIRFLLTEYNQKQHMFTNVHYATVKSK
jgi:hypothetical protein